MYFASTLDLAETFCVLPFHDMKLPPTNTQYPEVLKWSVYHLVWCNP